jgi:DNA-binding response OmpR family regulator
MKLQAGSLNLEERCLYLADGRPPVKFTRKEAHLLALLMQSPGQVVSRAKIMKEVWQTDYLGDTRTLDVHICRLRQKLEQDPANPQLLLTRRGVGYQLDVPENTY